MAVMGQPAARVGDLHTCPQTTPAPHIGGSSLPLGAVNIGGRPAARVGDLAACFGPPGGIAEGDTTAHGGVIALALPLSSMPA